MVHPPGGYEGEWGAGYVEDVTNRAAPWMGTQDLHPCCVDSESGNFLVATAQPGGSRILAPFASRPC
jgi:hypothetical protein